jgi:hypothetical protein
LDYSKFKKKKKKNKSLYIYQSKFILKQLSLKTGMRCSKNKSEEKPTFQAPRAPNLFLFHTGFQNLMATVPVPKKSMHSHTDPSDSSQPPEKLVIDFGL